MNSSLVRISASAFAFAFAFAASTTAFAAKTYQVTGPVLEVSDTKLVVQKGKEKFEMARSANTKVTGDLKVGSKVTVSYSMSAETVEAKGDAKK